MQASFYERLQSDFVMIRVLSDSTAFEQTQYDKTVLSIKEARRKINAHAKPQERKILLYCIDTLLEIIDEGALQKTHDFADAIHNIPEIYMQKRNLYSFRKELNRFQEKYGKQFFPFLNEVKPRFTKKAPRNKREFFLPASDEDFKRMHPTGYKWLVAAGITALILPQILYIAYCVFINPVPNEWTLMLGYVGSFIVGIGLFNIVAAWIHQYMGHLLTVVCLLGGAALTALSLYLLYT